MNTDGTAGGGHTDESGIRDLLERALAEVSPAPGDGYADQVLARARRIRRRRRAMATAAVTAVAAVAAVSLVPGGWGEWTGRGAGRTSAEGTPSHARAVIHPFALHPGGQVTPPSGTPGSEADQLARMRALLPAAVGTVTLRQSYTGSTSDSGDLDGRYQITRNGRVGGLTVLWGGTNIPHFSCSDPNQKEAGRLSCSVTELGDGRQLMIAGFGARDQQLLEGTTVEHEGPSYEAMLGLGNGRLLLVQDISGFTGPGAPGLAMAAPPLTTAQLAAFAQRPELAAGAPQN